MKANSENCDTLRKLDNRVLHCASLTFSTLSFHCHSIVIPLSFHCHSIVIPLSFHCHSIALAFGIRITLGSAAVSTCSNLTRSRGWSFNHLARPGGETSEHLQLNTNAKTAGHLMKQTLHEFANSCDYHRLPMSRRLVAKFLWSGTSQAMVIEFARIARSCGTQTMCLPKGKSIGVHVPECQCQCQYQ